MVRVVQLWPRMLGARTITLLVLCLCFAACAGSHELGPDDGAVAADASVPGDASACTTPRPGTGCVCVAGDWHCEGRRDAGEPVPWCGPPPAWFCLAGTPGGVCGDAGLMPICTAGGWGCPSGTIPSTMCACSGRPGPGCVCGASGWECPRPPASFDCGAAGVCLRGAEYCIHTLSDVGGVPDDWRCERAPIACEGRASCACVGGSAGFDCTDDGAGAVTVTRGGG